MIGSLVDDSVYTVVVVCYVLTTCVGNTSSGANSSAGSIWCAVVVSGVDRDTETAEVYYCTKADVLLGIVSTSGEVVVEGWGGVSLDSCAFVCEGTIGVWALGSTGPLVACGGDAAGEYDATPVIDGECAASCYSVIDCVTPVCGVSCVVSRG